MGEVVAFNPGAQPCPYRPRSAPLTRSNTRSGGGKPFGLGLFGGLLVRALRGQRISHGDVAFVAAVLVNLIARLARDRHPERPRLREGGRIVDVDFVVDHFRIDAREALDHAQSFAVRRAADGGPVREVPRLDDERVAFEVAARITHEEMDARAKSRPAVERNHARVVHHLVADDHGVGRLDDARAVAVHGRHERPDRPARDAPVVE